MADQRFGTVLIAFTLLAILVACLGLYAITSLTIAQRTKEVGVRKILGASVNSLLFLLSKNLLVLTIIAGLIALPIIQLSMSSWLQNYPYRVEVSLWSFLFPIGLIMLISALTIGYQLFKASVTNPSNLLRLE